MALYVSWMQAAEGDDDIVYDAQSDRAVVLGAMFSREGVLSPRSGQLKVSQRGAGPNMSVDIAVGRGAVFGDDASDQGTYVVTNTTVYNLVVPPPPGSGTRTHRVVGRVRDKRMNASWQVYDWIPELLPDTGSGTPALPPSAIPLARVAVAAGAGSITNAMITDDRLPASVGTAAVEGAFGPVYDGFVASDATRPLRWSVNPDGWVQLSGWIKWNTINNVVNAKELRTFGGTPLSDPAVKPPAFRDFLGSSDYGPIQYTVGPNGELYMRPQASITLTAGRWFSFDGCFYRI